MSSEAVESEVQKHNLELARDGLDNWIAGDREEAIAMFTDDVEVYVPPELGNAGSYRGIEQFRAWFQDWDEAWSEFTMEARSIEPVGERHVVVEMDSKGTGTASGIEVDNTLGWVMGVRDEKLEYISLLPDLQAAREHAREREGLA